MSLVSIYKSTLRSLFDNNTKRLIITTEYGHNLISNIFSQKDLLDIQIVGLFKLGDKEILKNTQINMYEKVFFVENENNVDEILKSLTLCNSPVYVVFYTPINNDTINKIKTHDTNNLICQIISGCLSLIPISDHSAINNKSNVLSVLRTRPKTIVTLNDKANKDFLNEIENKLTECVNTSSIFERQDFSSLLVGVPRSYDVITPYIIPWRYESMIHYYNIKFDDHMSHINDDFYSNNAYELYENVIRNFDIENKKAQKINIEKTSTTSTLSILELENINKTIKKHSDMLGKLSNILKEENIFEKSKEEQLAVIRKLNEQEKINFQKSRPIVYNAIYTSKSQTIKNESEYYQHVPRIVELIKKYTQENPQITKIFFYISDYICYEEVAQVELFNKQHTNQKVYLLSDNILNQWNYLAIMHNKTSHGVTLKFTKHLKNAIVTQTRENVKNEIDIIEDKIKELEKFPIVFFKESDEKKYKSLTLQITNMLNTEYEKLKCIVVKNKIDENLKNMETMKLNKLAIQFKKLENRTENLKKSTNFTNVFNEIDNTIQTSTLNDSKVVLKKNNTTYNDFLTNLIEEQDTVIDNLVEGIYDISKLSLELLLLVQEQSLQLDKIEVQLLSSEDYITKGTVELKEADKIDSKTMGIQQKIVFGLAVIATGLLAGIGIKFGKK